MNHHPEAPEIINCEICLKEVPVSNASSAEVHEYTLYFCGLECYDQWVNAKESEDSGHKEK